MNRVPLILICDDDPVIHESLGIYFKAEHFSYASALDGVEALEKFEALTPDLIILDLMMPGRSGTEVCREIRKTSKVPIIMLTAKGEEMDRVLGLELGADDYIVKPFSPREVVARIKAVLRRMDDGAQAPDKPDVLRYDGLEISMEQYQVTLSGRPVPLTPKEVEILYLLASHPGQVFKRDQILNQVWGYDFIGDTRTVDTHIKRIRGKLPENPRWALKTVYGVGYKFEVLP